ncbi:retrovirus-related pol polyprotein from transposon TNT 1-94 [Tanacetum coccineum]|uniref:Retrovirus-related pol polyprotein from transposon TNT 1-94 n=1 Tax=Tanacetum coccineum TaxID=301880 RepID=A0ABQ5IZZ0_9ASTR
MEVEIPHRAKAYDDCDKINIYERTRVLVSDIKQTTLLPTQKCVDLVIEAIADCHLSIPTYAGTSDDTKLFPVKMEILLEPTSNNLMVGTFKDGDGDTVFQQNQVHNRVLILKRLIRRYHESSSIFIKASALRNIQAFQDQEKGGAANEYGRKPTETAWHLTSDAKFLMELPENFDGTKSMTYGSSSDYTQDDIEVIDVDDYWINRKAITSEREHVNLAEAVKDKRWQSAIDSELEALEQNKTWTIEKLPPNKKALGCKWVYKIKYKSDGTTERFKARLVILGNHQVTGFDYSETFMPITKIVSVQVFLAIATTKQWELHQMEVHNALLHGDLKEVFMKLPPSLHKGQPWEACKLRPKELMLKKLQQLKLNDCNMRNT